MGGINLRPPLKLRWSYEGVKSFAFEESHQTVVVCLFPDGLACLDLNGEEKWKVNGQYAENLIIPRDEAFAIDANGSLLHIDLQTGNVKKTPFGPGSLVFVSTDGRSAISIAFKHDQTQQTYESFVVRRALVGDDHQQWKREQTGSLQENLAFISASTVRGALLFVAKRSARLLCLSIETGDILWDADVNQSKPDANLGVAADLRVAPLVSGSIVLAPTPFGFGAFRIETGELLWRHGVHAGPFNVYKDRLYMATGINFTGYRIVDMNTGETLFQREVSDDIAKTYRFAYVKLNSGFAITESHTFVGDNFGRLWALERDTGEPVWYHHPKGAVPYVALRQPVILGNRLYINGFSTDPNRPQHLYCYEQT